MDDALTQLITNSSLPAADKDMWLRALPKLDGNMATMISDIVTNDPSQLPQLTKRVRDLQGAIKDENVELLDELLELKNNE